MFNVKNYLMYKKRSIASVHLSEYEGGDQHLRGAVLLYLQ